MIHEGVLGVELRDGQARFVHVGKQREMVEAPVCECSEGWEDGPEFGPERNMPQWDGAPMRLAETLDWMLLAHTAPSPPLGSHTPSPQCT